MCGFQPRFKRTEELPPFPPPLKERLNLEAVKELMDKYIRQFMRHRQSRHQSLRSILKLYNEDKELFSAAWLSRIPDDIKRKENNPFLTEVAARIVADERMSVETQVGKLAKAVVRVIERVEAVIAREREKEQRITLKRVREEVPGRSVESRMRALIKDFWSEEKRSKAMKGLVELYDEDPDKFVKAWWKRIPDERRRIKHSRFIKGLAELSGEAAIKEEMVRDFIAIINGVEVRIKALQSEGRLRTIRDADAVVLEQLKSHVSKLKKAVGADAMESHGKAIDGLIELREKSREAFVKAWQAQFGMLRRERQSKYTRIQNLLSYEKPPAGAPSAEQERYEMAKENRKKFGALLKAVEAQLNVLEAQERAKRRLSETRDIIVHKTSQQVEQLIAAFYCMERAREAAESILNLYEKDPEVFAMAWREVNPDDEKRQKRNTHLSAIAISLSEDVLSGKAERFLEILSDIEERIGRKRSEEIVYGVLTDRAIRKAQPLNVDAIKNRVGASIMEKKPLRLAILWGGYKESEAGVADTADTTALSMLTNLKKSIGEFGIKAEVELIFCDVHAMKFNGRTQEQTEKYLSSLSNTAAIYGIKIVKLSDLYKNWEKSPVFGMAFRKAKEHADMLWKSDSSVKAFEEMAARHSEFVREGVPAETAAKLYFRIRTLESIFLDAEYSDAIFVSTGIRQLEEKFSDLPTIFVWLIERGRGDAPWFITWK